jgi:hypothetical protein
MDFTNVKEGGIFRPKRRPEGEYPARVVKVEDHQPKDSSKPMGWVFTVKIKGDERSTYPVYASPEESQAWKIRKMFIAAGQPVPKKRVMVDPNRLVNKDLGVYLEDDEYEGRMKSTIADFIPLDDLQPNGDEDDDYEDEVEEEEVEETPPPRKRTARKRQPEPEPEEDEEEEEPPARRPAKKAASRRRAPEPEEEDEEEEEEPAPRRRAAKKTTRRKATSDDDLDDLDLEEL